MVSVDLFRNETNIRLCKKDEKIFDEGQSGDCMYVVLDGQVDLLVNGKCVESLAAGGVFGEMALIDSVPRSATAVVRTDGRLAPVDRKRFTYLVQQTPFFAIQIMRVMADRLRRMNARV
jgi:CRP/FNR family cyclic AMP-dependent transcriptional regulator